MKHLRFNRAIVAIAMMLIGWLPSLAHDFEVDDVFYNVISTTEVEVTYKGSSYDEFYYDEYNGSVVIPSLVEYYGFTYSVTSIGDSAFFDCYNLTDIEIPNSVTSIGDSAFYGCSSLTSIEIPNSVTSIGDSAFFDCYCLTSIQIPNSVTSIGDYAFSRCSSLTNIQIPNSVTSIGNDAFSDCESLTSIEIPNSVTSIGDSAFFDCNSLTSIEIPNSVTSIGNYAFSNCKSLTSIQIPNSVTSIGNYAFASCSNLTNVVIGKNVTSIKDHTFYFCESLIDIEISNSVTNIEDYAFYFCESLRKIEIPNSVASIGDLTFCDCFNLTEVIIGNSVESIGERAFFNCSNMSKFTCLTTIPPKLHYEALRSCYSANLYVLEGCKCTYESTDYWKKFNNITEITLADSVALDKTEIEMILGETFLLTATVLPESATNKSIKWKTSNEAIAKVNVNGLVIATAVGEATITATTTDGSNLSSFCKVTIMPSLAESIALDNIELYLKATETATLVATVLPHTVSNKKVEWTSSNESVAIVDVNGLVTAYSVGEATITATTTDGTNLSASCKVIVVPTLAESIALNKTEISLEATETATLVATVLPELTTDKSIEWSSSDETVVIVDENGVVTAIAVGEATITATTTDGSNLSASCKVVVNPTLATSITLNHTEYEMVEKAEFQLTATILPELATNKGVIWSSSDKWVASVDENGLVRAYSVGEAIITATTIDGSNLSASCKVTVISILAQSITLDKTAISLEATESITLIASVLPETTANKGIEWSSSDESVATIDANGLVTAVAVGEAIITAIATDGSLVSATCQVTVIPTLAMSIELDKTEASVEEKSEFQLTATILPEHTTNKEVAWSSSDKWVATVDNTGLVTIHSAGEVIITATTTDGSNLSATCRINVYSGIDGVNDDDVIVATVSDNIVVKNAKLGSVVNVYASNGALVASEEATDGSVVVEAPVKGVYVIKVGKQTVKVII